MKQASKEELAKRASWIITRLKKEYPEARTALVFSDPLELLVSTILSAQFTDARVIMVTPALFTKYRNDRYFAAADKKEMEG